MKLAVCFFAAALALLPVTAFAGGRTLWQDGGVQLCGPSASTPMTAVSDSAGGAIVVWEDVRQWPDGIYAQRVNGSGVPLWTDCGIAIDDSSIAGRICVVADGENGVIVVWGYSSTGASIAVQRLDAEGTPLWGANGLEIRPLVGNPPLDNHPAVVSDGHGGAIVAWTANVVVSGPLDTLIACRVDSSGTKRWETVIYADTLDVAAPCLCEDGLGGVIVAWQEYEAGVRHVRVQRIDSAGAIRWGATGVRACTLSTTQGARACVVVGQSRFVVGWFGGAGTWQHRAQMFDLAGTRLWGLAGMPVSGGFSYSSSSVGLPAGSAGQSVWAWSENRTVPDEFYAQKLDSAGTRCWDSAGVWFGGTDTSWIRGFSATTDGRGGAIAAWALYRSRLNWDVHAQHVDSAGNLCWTDTGLAVCAGDDNVRYPVAVTDGEGGAIIAWLDDRGLYAQRVADGAAVEETVNDECRTMNVVLTVTRGVLFLPEATSRKPQAASLWDPAGRRAAVLKSGPNDIRHLAPGVYFVREERQASSRRLQVVRKVVITR